MDSGMALSYSPFSGRKPWGVACNLCINVCPVEACITVERLAPSTVDPRTGETVRDDHGDWTTHPNNPMRTAAE